MEQRKNMSIGRGQSYRQETAPTREKEVGNKNKAMPSGMGGDVNNLSHTLGGNKEPSGKKE